MDPCGIELYARRLGLKPVFAQAWMADHAGERPWRVATVERGLCTLFGFDDDGEFVERRARPPLAPIAVGDWAVLADDDQEPPQVTGVLERHTWLRRGSAHREGESQLIAANLDTVFIVAAFADTVKLERRALRARRLDRFIAAVSEGGATPVVVLNKVDLTDRDVDELEALCGELASRLGGVDVLVASALDSRGLDSLAARLLPGDAVAFIGPSGVGKSSLINALVGEERQRVGGTRTGDTKGRHTTTRRELVPLPTGALLIDTPGVREFAIAADDHVSGFDDITELGKRCRFTNCGHDSEPGCAVLAAIERGEFDTDRLDSFRDLESETRRLSAKRDGYTRHMVRAEDRRFGRMVKRAKDIKNTRNTSGD